MLTTSQAQEATQALLHAIESGAELRSVAAAVAGRLAELDATEDARELILAVESIAQALTAGVASEATLAAAADELRALLCPVDRPLPPPMSELVRQGVSHRQIARMYGWVSPGGEPEVEKVREELAAPGRHFDAGRYRGSPAARRLDTVNALWARRRLRRARGGA